jgi:hypothetical protein
MNGPERRSRPLLLFTRLQTFSGEGRMAVQGPITDSCTKAWSGPSDGRNRCACRLVCIVDPWRDPGLRRHARRDMLVRIAQRARRPLDSQEIAQAGPRSEKNRRGGCATSERRGRRDRSRTHDIGERGAGNLPFVLRECAEMIVPHGFMLITQCLRLQNSVSAESVGARRSIPAPAKPNFRRKAQCRPCRFQASRFSI